MLIFDEVITGFRLSFGGFAEISGIRPDIVTWGKIIGGGFPVGAFAAKKELMDRVAPLGPVYQAGTLSANPVAMTAGLATLRKLIDGEVYAQLETLGRFLDETVDQLGGFILQRMGSMFWLLPGENGHTDSDGEREPIRAKGQIPDRTATRYAEMFQRLLKSGIYFPPGAFEVAFLSTTHDESHIESLRDALVR